jgi:hypothetical protein
MATLEQLTNYVEDQTGINQIVREMNARLDLIFKPDITLPKVKMFHFCPTVSGC